MIDDVKTGDPMTSRLCVLSQCSDLSTNKSLNLTIGYIIGDQCQNCFGFLFSEIK